VVCIALLFSFRTWRGVVVPALTTGIGTIWTVGLMGFLDVPINIATLVLPTFLMAVGNAYATHVVAFHRDDLRAGEPGRRVVPCRHAYRIPVLVTAFTTILGFASLLAYRITAIRDLGFFAAVGIAALSCSH